MDDDTEILLATLASILDDKFTTDELLEALVVCNGDIHAAADHLRCSQTRRGMKRRRDLSDWLESHQVDKIRRKSDSAVLQKASSSTSVSQPPLRTSKLTVHDVLKPPPAIPKPPEPVQRPPLTLMTPQMVQDNTPCTLHRTSLPPDLACRLYYSLLDMSRGWSRNKWWLFDKVVESPHLTSFFVRDQAGQEGEWKQAAQHWYNGRPTPPPEKFTVEMEEACKYVEKIVNQELRQRKRYALEWVSSEWRVNVAAVNCYNGPKESVGFHSDQLTYLGPYPTIASLSLGTTRIFRLREVVPRSETHDRKAQTFDIPLPHNSVSLAAYTSGFYNTVMFCLHFVAPRAQIGLVLHGFNSPSAIETDFLQVIIMHAATQENFKHSIPPQRVVDAFRATVQNAEGEEEKRSDIARINITFRFYRPDFSPQSTPRCKCNIPCILKPDMKGRSSEGVNTYWWTCYAGAQNEGKGCSTWQKME